MPSTEFISVAKFYLVGSVLKVRCLLFCLSNYMKTTTRTGKTIRDLCEKTDEPTTKPMQRPEGLTSYIELRKHVQSPRPWCEKPINWNADEDEEWPMAFRDQKWHDMTRIRSSRMFRVDSGSRFHF